MTETTIIGGKAAHTVPALITPPKPTFASAPVTAPDWSHLRPWRNNNPGDLRALPPGDVWKGQIGLDVAPGGPFAIFQSRVMGWRALSVCLLTYYVKHDLQTVDAIIDRYAPPQENDTAAYKDLVCSHLGVARGTRIDPTQPNVMKALVTAIALAEGGARISWLENEKSAGVCLALGITPAPEQA